MPPRKKRSNWRHPVVYDDNAVRGRRTTRAAATGQASGADTSGPNYAPTSRGASRRGQAEPFGGGNAVNISKSRKRPKAWIEVHRPPAPGIRFTVPVWVEVDELTATEREQYADQLPENKTPEPATPANNSETEEKTPTATPPPEPSTLTSTGRGDDAMLLDPTLQFPTDPAEMALFDLPIPATTTDAAASAAALDSVPLSSLDPLSDIDPVLMGPTTTTNAAPAPFATAMTASSLDPNPVATAAAGVTASATTAATGVPAATTTNADLDTLHLLAATSKEDDPPAAKRPRQDGGTSKE